VFDSVLWFLFSVFALWLVFVLLVTRFAPDHADKIVKAAGLYFPFRHRPRRRER
jgi:hypothetical protein